MDVEMGRKLGRGLRPFLGEGDLVPIQHKVAWAEAYTSMPSTSLIHSAVWPQQTWAENFGVLRQPFGEGERVPI